MAGNLDPYGNHSPRNEDARRSRSREPSAFEPALFTDPNSGPTFEDQLNFPNSWAGVVPRDNVIEPILFDINHPVSGYNTSLHAQPWSPNQSRLNSNSYIVSQESQSTQTHFTLGAYDPRLHPYSAPTTPNPPGLLSVTSHCPQPYQYARANSTRTGQGLHSSNTSHKSGSPSRYTPSSSAEEAAAPSKENPTVDREPLKVPTGGKRRFDQGLLSFRVNQEQHPRSRRRTALAPKAREETAFSRRVGICARCKAQKVKFKFQEHGTNPCEKCIKFARNDMQLSRAICIRDTLKDVRFGGIDILFVAYTEQYLKEEIVSYQGSLQDIDVLLLHDYESSMPKRLTITIQNYSTTAELEGDTPYHMVAVDNSTFKRVDSDRYAIPPHLVPTADTLLDWVQMELEAAEGVPSQRLIIALIRFMTKYCEDESILPLTNLVSSTIKILKLLRCWRSGKMVALDDDQPSNTYASKAVASQILLVVKEEIRTQELFLLNELDDIIYKGRGLDGKNIVPLWTCFWSLILTYRDCMKVYTQYSYAPRSDKRRPGSSDHVLSISTCQRMYTILTTFYAAIFWNTSPLYMDWRVDVHFELLGQNESLRDAFHELKNEVDLFYDSCDELGPDDVVLKENIIDKELISRPSRASNSRSTTSFSSNHG